MQKDAIQNTDFSRLNCQLKRKKNWHTVFVMIFQVSANGGMGKQSKLVKFWTQKLFQIHACVISTWKAKQLDTTTMFTYSHANTPLGRSELAYNLSYFINWRVAHQGAVVTFALFFEGLEGLHYEFLVGTQVVSLACTNSISCTNMFFPHFATLF